VMSQYRANVVQYLAGGKVLASGMSKPDALRLARDEDGSTPEWLGSASGYAVTFELL